VARPIILSNNRLLVGINDVGMVHDFYYPYIGLENHVSSAISRHKIGVWANGRFSWLDDGNWKITQVYEPYTLIGLTTAENAALKIKINFTDFVATSENVLFRHIKVENLGDQMQEIRIFLHQMFQIAESTRGDTAMYIPDERIILDYKGRRAFAIFAEDDSGQSFDQYSIGNYGIEGKEGTFKDAEDGELSGNNIEHGRVDSVIRFAKTLQPDQWTDITYWIVAGMTNSDAIKIHKKILSRGYDHYLQETTAYWRKWLRPALRKTTKMGEDYRASLIHSLLITKSHIDARGAIIASCDSQMLNYARDYYSYCWPRDAAYIILPLIELGYDEEAKSFFEFSRDVLDEEGYLLHKYLSDRSVGSSWHPAIQQHHSELPIQEDETAIVIYVLCQYLKDSGDIDFVRRLYHTLVQPATRFMANHIDESTRLPHASYDLWEEKFLTTSYTVSVVYAALKSAAELAEILEFADDAISWESAAEDIRKNFLKYLYDKDQKILIKGYLLSRDGSIKYDQTVDVSSLYGVMRFGLLPIDDEAVTNTLQRIETSLLSKSPIGGIGRYEMDHYNSPNADYGGNPWVITTLWMSQIYLMINRRDDAERLISLVLSWQSPSGILPEQVDPVSGQYLSVAPLIWSQSELVRTLRIISKK